MRVVQILLFVVPLCLFGAHCSRLPFICLPFKGSEQPLIVRFADPKKPRLGEPRFYCLLFISFTLPNFLLNCKLIFLVLTLYNLVIYFLKELFFKTFSAAIIIQYLISCILLHHPTDFNCYVSSGLTLTLHLQCQIGTHNHNHIPSRETKNLQPVESLVSLHNLITFRSKMLKQYPSFKHLRILTRIINLRLPAAWRYSFLFVVGSVK